DLKYVQRGYHVFLAQVIEMKEEDKSEEKQLEDVPIVRDFSEVFRGDLLRLSPMGQVEFQIDLILGAAPVARSPYRLDPSEMQELSNQLQELADKGFMKPTSGAMAASTGIKGKTRVDGVDDDSDDDGHSATLLLHQATAAACESVTPSEPIESLSMGDEHLDTILATKSDEFIKSCVENLVPKPSKSEGENECDSFSDEDFSKKIYSNPLFDEEIIPMEIDKHSFNAKSDLIESMPNHDSSITISLKIDSLFDEFIEIIFDNSHADIESFSPSPILRKDSDSNMKEIDLSFNPDDPMPPGIEEDDDDSKRDIPILEELLDNYSLSLPANESYHFDILSPYRPPAKPPDGKTGTLNIKMIGDVSDQKVPIPNLTITRILNQEKSPDLLSGINEPGCHPEKETHFVKRLLYDNSSPRPPEEFVSENSDAEIESFSPSPIPVEDGDSLMKEIDLSFTLDYPMPPEIEDDDDDSERDILISEELLSNDSLSLPENKSFHFDISSSFRPPAKPPYGNTGILNEKYPDLLSHQGLEAIQPSVEGPMIHGKNTPILDIPLFHFYPP
nr:putative reverse transcriptase domain-containing protein [Tanacetum cinerariifolium]